MAEVTFWNIVELVSLFLFLTLLDTYLSIRLWKCAGLMWMDFIGTFGNGRNQKCKGIEMETGMDVAKKNLGSSVKFVVGIGLWTSFAVQDLGMGNLCLELG